jgi:hypothetical protein
VSALASINTLSAVAEVTHRPGFRLGAAPGDFVTKARAYLESNTNPDANFPPQARCHVGRCFFLGKTHASLAPSGTVDESADEPAAAHLLVEQMAPRSHDSSLSIDDDV